MKRSADVGKSVNHNMSELLDKRLRRMQPASMFARDPPAFSRQQLLDSTAAARQHVSLHHKQQRRAALLSPIDPPAAQTLRSPPRLQAAAAAAAAPRAGAPRTASDSPGSALGSVYRLRVHGPVLTRCSGSSPPVPGTGRRH